MLLAIIVAWCYCRKRPDASRGSASLSMTKSKRRSTSTSKMPAALRQLKKSRQDGKQDAEVTADEMKRDLPTVAYHVTSDCTTEVKVTPDIHPLESRSSGFDDSGQLDYV